jgi:ER membrane protein complex subunit 1
MRLLSALFATLLPTVLAVFQDEAWQVDYHHALLGLPQRHTTFFHRPQSSSKASLLYTLSELGLLGAINPKDGTLVWRQKLQPGPQSNSSFLFAGDGHTSVVGGVDGQIASWSAIDVFRGWTGKLVNRFGSIKTLGISYFAFTGSRLIRLKLRYPFQDLQFGHKGVLYIFKQFHPAWEEDKSDSTRLP